MANKQAGQALLIILLLMAVVLTISMAVISRSVTDLRVSRQDEESSRAFSAAEAGIENAVALGGSGDSSGTINGVDYTVACTDQGGDVVFDFGKERFEQGKIQTVWLVNHDTNGEITTGGYGSGQLDLYWGTDANEQHPALEATLYYKDGVVIKVKRAAYDANAAANQNNFGAVTGGNFGINGVTYYNSASFDMPTGNSYYALRLKLLYNNSTSGMAVRGEDALPSQGTCCDSTAEVSASGVTRKIRQCRFYKAPPGIFDYVLYSGGNLVK